jgi:hypothetical protein
MILLLLLLLLLLAPRNRDYPNKRGGNVQVGNPQST